MLDQCTSRPTLADRLWRRVLKTDTCWLWQGVVNDKGYGYIGVRREAKRMIGTHVAAWEMASGESLPRWYQIGHTCDTPNCVRNDDQGTYKVGGVWLPRWGHLFRGTTQDNTADKLEKGRGMPGGARGVDHHMAKLSHDDVMAIRTMGAERTLSHREIAERFGVAKSTVTRVINGLNRRHD
jgi:hypothetical protein